MLNKAEAVSRVNALAGQKTPFLFISDFKGERNHVLTLDEIDIEAIRFQINGYANGDWSSEVRKPITLKRNPISFEQYQKKFNQVMAEIEAGNTYLLNLTSPTPVQSDATLLDVFYASNARYRLWFKDEFVVFSPEIFIQIKNGQLSSYPMKGTIDADLPNARELLINSQKEMAEHATIVDLIRNDMSILAKQVRVEKFRYIDEIRTNHKHLLQVSSQITGQLEPNYHERLGDLIFSLLPAGSITGAPKPKTLEIINRVEGYDRGYYTGIVGYFDGENFDSGVMIRFIEKQNGQWLYKSGGGIHALSEARAEYQEMMDKVYVPIY